MKKYQFLSGSALKTLALAAMLIDHIAVSLLRKTGLGIITLGALPLNLYSWMRAFGRIAFPIYSFLLTEGYIHTKSLWKYARNLLCFALISEIPWNLIHADRLFYLRSQNVFFTLFLGLMGIWVIDCITDKKSQIFCLSALLLTSFLLKADYGATGFSFILIMFLLRENRFLQSIIGAGFLSPYAGLAAPPICLYSGKRGYIHGYRKYLFYAAYPVHMMVLWILQHRLGIW